MGFPVIWFHMERGMDIKKMDSSGLGTEKWPNEAQELPEELPLARNTVDAFATPELSRLVTSASKDAALINQEYIDRGGVIAEGNNPGLDYILEKAPQIADWREVARDNPWLALGPFYRPNEDMRDIEGNSTSFEPETKAWLTDQLLGSELRWRAAEETNILKECFLDKSNANALILACGSGFYPICAAHDVRSEYPGNNHSLQMVDINARVKPHIERLASKRGIDTKVFIRDILHMRGYRTDNFGSLAVRSMMNRKLQPVDNFRQSIKPADITTMIGLGMYVPRYDFMYKKTIAGREVGIMKKGLEESVGAMIDYTKPGGTIMFDVMKRPNNETLDDPVYLQHRVIEMMNCWPKFQLYGENEVLDMIDQSEFSSKIRDINIESSPGDLFEVFTLRKV